jgi:hypothetical protein
MEKRIETAINRIIGDLQDRGLFSAVSKVELETEDIDEGLLVTVRVILQGHENVEYQFLFLDEVKLDG